MDPNDSLRGDRGGGSESRCKPTHGVFDGVVLLGVAEAFDGVNLGVFASKGNFLVEICLSIPIPAVILPTDKSGELLLKGLWNFSPPEVCREPFSVTDI